MNHKSLAVLTAIAISASITGCSVADSQQPKLESLDLEYTYHLPRNDILSFHGKQQRPRTNVFDV
ncbi:hypothetical protein, partial [Vibrio sp. 10N.222.52.B7]